MAKDTVTHPSGPPGTPAKKLTTLGDGRPHGGSSGINRNAERMHNSEFKGSGMLRPPSKDTHPSAGLDGVVEGSVNVPRTRIMGKQDPRAGKR